MFQEIIVFIIVGLAAAYLARTVWRTLSSRRACGGCGGSCGGKVAPAAPQQLVQIQMNVRPKPPERG